MNLWMFGKYTLALTKNICQKDIELSLIDGCRRISGVEVKLTSQFRDKVFVRTTRNRIGKKHFCDFFLPKPCS